MPFPSPELKTVVTRLLEIIVKAKVFQLCKVAIQLKDVNLTEKNN